MPKAVEIKRIDHSSRDLRKIAGQALTPEATRRMLAIAHVLDGISREKAAHLAGMDRQSLRDWVHRYNEQGIEGLYNRKAPGMKPRLEGKLKAELREIVLKGPDLAKDGIVRWRCCDLKDLIEKKYSVSYHERYIGSILDGLGLSYITGRPRHLKGDPQKQEDFKKTSRRSSPQPSPTTPKTRKSRSGSRMKQGSAKKAV